MPQVHPFLLVYVLRALPALQHVCVNSHHWVRQVLLPVWSLQTRTRCLKTERQEFLEYNTQQQRVVATGNGLKAVSAKSHCDSNKS